MTATAIRPARVTFLHQPPVAHHSEPAPREAVALIAAVVEAMMGRRPLHQLRPHLELSPFGRLVEYVDLGWFRRTTVGGIRAQMPTSAAVEASVRLASTAHWLSCVIRLDAGAGAWRCTDLLVLRPTATHC